LANDLKPKTVKFFKYMIFVKRHYSRPVVKQKYHIK